MKKIIISIMLFGVMGLLITSCKYDNYDKPNVYLKGALIYNNVDTVFVRQSSGNNIDQAAVYFNLFEPGWQKTYSTPIRVVVDAGGTFSSILFPATYKLVVPAGNGPFIASTDTTVVKLDGSKTINIPVTPYYLVRNFAPTLSASDSTVTANVKVDQIVTGANAKSIGSVYMYINRTAIVDGGNNLASVNISGGSITDPTKVILKAKIPNLAKISGLGIATNQKQFFVRIGVRINGSTEVYSSVKTVSLP
ncbi:MAG: DUF3823 domain-containing protein [Bacteroidetes bacterium]|nr:DUF3823 domain-containing protein [Bacteroidota bacterium]